MGIGHDNLKKEKRAALSLLGLSGLLIAAIWICMSARAAGYLGDEADILIYGTGALATATDIGAAIYAMSWTGMPR